MTTRTRLFVTLIALATPGLAGCMPKMTIEQMKADMPERPAELDRLNVFVGTWESEGVAEFGGLDRTLAATSTMTCDWANEDWHLVCDEDAELEEFGKMKATWIMTYDGKAKKFRSWWFASIGEVSTGTSTFDESTQTWNDKGKSRAEWGNSTYSGSMKIVDNNTVDWDYTQRAFFGLFKVAHFKGTMRRK